MSANVFVALGPLAYHNQEVRGWWSKLREMGFKVWHSDEAEKLKDAFFSGEYDLMIVGGKIRPGSLFPQRIEGEIGRHTVGFDLVKRLREGGLDAVPVVFVREDHLSAFAPANLPNTRVIYVEEQASRLVQLTEELLRTNH